MTISYQEAANRLDSGKVVMASFNTEHGCETERVLASRDLESYSDADDVCFGYDEVAEAEAEKIFSTLRDEVKVYLYMLLLTEN